MAILHTKITIETICKNGSEKYGTIAKTRFRPEDISHNTSIELEKHGTNKVEALSGLLSFLSDNGKTELKEVENL